MEQVLTKTLNKQGVKGVLRLGVEYATLKLRPSYMLHLPSSLQIEPTIRCNLKCTMCDRTFWDRSAPDMSLEDYKKFVDQFTFVRKVTIQGLGEPTLHPQIAEMIRYAKEERRFMTVGLITNGTLLTEGISKKLIDSGLDMMGISIDSPIAREYEEIRPGAKFDIVMRNLKRFVELNNDKVMLDVGMTCGLKTIEHAPQLMDLIYEAGVRRFAVKGIHLWGKEFWEEKMGYNQLKHDVAKAKRIFYELERKAKRYNMQFHYTFFKDKKQRWFGSDCLWPWVSTYVTVDGYVTPCGIHGTDPRKFSFGNLHEKSFKEIWNSPAYQEFRKKLKSSEPDAFCKGCPEL